MEIEINGIWYKEVPKQEELPQIQYSAEMLFYMGMYGVYRASRQWNAAKLRINTIEEFKLIQEKKSKLSRNQRDLVVKRFNKLFTKIYYEQII